jgi:glycosyltransferase involved in cell wall biosynthesis
MGIVRIGWLADKPQMMGGAELSTKTLLNHTPDGVEIVQIAPGEDVRDVDAYVVQNCTTYDASAIPMLASRPVLKCVRDFWTMADKELRAWLLEHSKVVTFSSPLHVQTFQKVFPFNHSNVHLIPVPVDPAPVVAAADASTHREGVFWVGPMHSHQGIGEAVAWAEKEQVHVDFYGDGPVRPRLGPYATYHGWLHHSKVPAMMAAHEAILFLPFIAEPFGRVVLEAAFAGCKVYANEMVGGAYWINERPETAGAGINMFGQLAVAL